MTTQTFKVLGAIGHGREGMSGSMIARETGLSSGTLYPILLRLEEVGWVASEWETGSPQELGRPRRRYYELTAKGAANYRTAEEDIRPHLGRLAWT